MLRVDVDVPHSALFSPIRARRIIDDLINDAEKASAEEARRLIHEHLDRVMREPTGHYLSQVQVHRYADGWRVDDNGVVYGPWLEGTGSRNSPHTRFKGYAAFRRAKQQMARQTDRITQRMVRRHIRRLT